MRKRLLTVFVVLASAYNAAAQEVSPTDLSRYELFEEGETIKTLTELQDMEDAYKALVADGNCGAAIPAIVEFYEAANRVSNLIRRGNEPYYDAGYDDYNQEVARRVLGPLVDEINAAENTFNNLILQRNRAWVEEAKCLLAEGEKQEAVARLYRALDYISSGERKLWEEARRLLWAEVGFSAEN